MDLDPHPPLDLDHNLDPSVDALLDSNDDQIQIAETPSELALPIATYDTVSTPSTLSKSSTSSTAPEYDLVLDVSVWGIPVPLLVRRQTGPVAEGGPSTHAEAGAHPSVAALLAHPDLPVSFRLCKPELGVSSALQLQQHTVPPLGGHGGASHMDYQLHMDHDSRAAGYTSYPSMDETDGGISDGGHTVFSVDGSLSTTQTLT